MPDGDGFRVYWQAETRLVSSHVNAAGVTGAPEAVVSPISAASVAASGAGPVIAWRDGSEIHIAVDDGSRPLVPAYSFPANWSPTTRCSGTRCAVAALTTVALFDAAAKRGSNVALDDEASSLAVDPNGFAVSSLFNATRYDLSGARLWRLSTLAYNRTLDFDGVRYNAAWTDAEDVRVAAFLPDGTLTPARTVYTSHFGVSGIELQCNGPQHLLAFGDQTGGFPGPEHEPPPSNVVALRLNRDLAPLDPAPITLGGTREVNFAPHAACNGPLWNVSWSHVPFFTGPPTPQTAVIAPASVGVAWLQSGAIDQTGAAVAATDDQRLVVYLEKDQTVSTSRLFMMQMSDDGAQLQNPRMLDAAVNEPARTAPFGSDFIVAWTSLTANEQSMAAVVHSFGAVTAVPLAPNERVLAAGSNGSSAVVLTSPGRGAHLWRIARTGQLLTPVPIVLSSDYADMGAVASDGNRFLIAWATPAPHVALLAGDGTPIISDRKLNDANFSDTIAAAWNGHEYLVVAGSGPFYRATRLSSEGAVIAFVDFGAGYVDASIVPSRDGWLIALLPQVTGDPGPRVLHLDAAGGLTGPDAVPGFVAWSAAPDGALVSVFQRPVEGANALFLRDVTEVPSPQRRRVAPR